MRVFVTGATGFIGSRLVPKLIAAGHSVVGLTRSEEGAEKLRQFGAEPHFGNTENLDSLRAGAAKTDSVIHLAFNHDDFSQFLKHCEDDRKAILAMGDVLLGTDKIFVVTSGTAIAANIDGQPSTEESATSDRNPRAASEAAVRELAAKGVRTSVVRLAQIHDTRKQGLVPYVTAAAKQKGVSAYIGDGNNRWPAAPVDATAELYKLAFEKAEAGAIYHAVAEEGIPMKAIAEAIGRGLKVPVVSLKAEDAGAHFGWLAMSAAHDMPSSSAITQKKLGWNPAGPGLIEDLDRMDYSDLAV